MQLYWLTMTCGLQAFCIYPLALAIRATNVYEERSLGIHNDEEDTLRAGIANLRKEKGYTKFHLREQLAVSGLPRPSELY